MIKKVPRHQKAKNRDTTLIRSRRCPSHALQSTRKGVSRSCKKQQKNLSLHAIYLDLPVQYLKQNSKDCQGFYADFKENILIYIQHLNFPQVRSPKTILYQTIP